MILIAVMITDLVWKHKKNTVDCCVCVKKNVVCQTAVFHG